MGFEIINKIKKEKGLTNAQLARLSGVTLSTLDKITAGINTNPTLDTLQAICRALGCRLDDFDDTRSAQKNAPALSAEALDAAERYDELDEHGREIVDFVLSKEHQRATNNKFVVLKIAGRDGSFREEKLRQEQADALSNFCDKLPDAGDL
ncbi:MAG: helix-turn-helix transcriptional regulator [Oscillospiraceae bacterium]